MQRKTTLIGLFIFIVFQIDAQWINFSAPTSRLVVGDILVTGNAITVEALINMQNYSPAQEAHDIVSKHYGISDLTYLLRPDNFGIRTNEGFQSTSHNIPLCYDSTYHLAGTYDGDSIRFYINGEAVSSTEWHGTLEQNSYLTAIGNVSPPTIYNEQFVGYIDEVRIWSVARTAQELTSNMFTLPDPTSQSGLIAYYNFNGTYANQQGNTGFDGVTEGVSLSNVSNPFFFGNVSTTFCFPTYTTEVDVTANSMLIFPNPSSTSINISFENSNNEFSEIELTNILGETIQKSNCFGTNLSLNIDHLTSGVYFVTLKNATGNQTKRFVKQ